MKRVPVIVLPALLILVALAFVLADRQNPGDLFRTATPSPIPTLTQYPVAELTHVIVFQPAGLPKQERSGSCWSGSNVLNREDAWRCMADNSIYDPCFSIPGDSQAVICDTSPLNDSPGFKLELTEALPSRGTISPEKSAWAIEFEDGSTCSFLEGATATFQGERINYSCSDGWMILGELHESQIWTAQKVRLSQDLSTILQSIQVLIKVVWL